MRIDIFNVGHGQCVTLTASNGRRMMLDCGDRWGDDRFWTPSLHFFRETIDLLGLMKLDEDHLSDFKNVMQHCTVPWILSNPTVGPLEFAVLKKDGMGPGAEAVAAWLAQLKKHDAAFIWLVGSELPVGGRFKRLDVGNLLDRYVFASDGDDVRHGNLLGEWSVIGIHERNYSQRTRAAMRRGRNALERLASGGETRRGVATLVLEWRRFDGIYALKRKRRAPVTARSDQTGDKLT